MLREIKLSERHPPTGATLHYREGVLLPPPAALQIARYPSDTGFYLLYLDGDGNEQTDTWHETLEAAQHQAQFEFGVTPSEWLVPGSEPPTEFR